MEENTEVIEAEPVVTNDDAPAEAEVAKPSPAEFAESLRILKAVVDTKDHSPRIEEVSKRDPDKVLLLVKQLVVQNYNAHRDTSRSPELSIDSVYIVWFAKVLSNWKAIVASPVIRGLIWEVTFNEYKNEAFLEIFKKLNNVKVSLGDSR